MPRYFTTQEVAGLFKTTTEHVRRLIRSGKLPADNVALGSVPAYRIRSEQLEAFLRRGVKP